MTWTVEEHELSEGFSCIVYDERGRAVADHLDHKTARLIAAAPDLLNAVEALVECFIKRGPFDEPLGSSEQAPSINAGIAALSKARGETA